MTVEVSGSPQSDGSLNADTITLKQPLVRDAESWLCCSPEVNVLHMQLRD